MSTGLSPVWAFPVPPDDPTFTAPPILSPTMPLPGAGGPPEPPQFVPPEVLAAPRPGFRERLGMALEGTPDFVPSRGATGGQSFLGGLLSGAAQGFSRGVAGEAKTARETREQANALSKAEADRNWANAQETWKARLTDYYKTKADERGKVLVTKQMATEMGVPLAAGSYRDPIEVGTKIREMKSAARVPAELASTMGKPAGAETTVGEIMQARSFLKPKTENTISPEVLQSRVESILHGIATGNLNPDISLYGTNRDGLKSALAAAADMMGLDLVTLRQNWDANKKGLATANSPQQLRMRQAAQNIPVLLDQMAGPPDENGMRVGNGGVIASLKSGRVPWWNQIAQTVQKGTGNAGALKQYNILASKLAMEQAFLMSGGNQPPKELYETLKAQYAASDNPENIYAALSTVDETVRGYQQSIGEVGVITPSSPYVPGAPEQNPIGGRTFKQGATPPAGSIVPARTGYVRIMHADGTEADWPKGRPVPAGWRVR